MDLDRLRTFALAAEELNFTQTARLLHLSQPAVSQQIRELEDSLGVDLFERRGRGLALTPAGERLKPLASTLLRDAESLKDALAEFRGVPQGVLRIGAGTTLGIYLLPYVLGRFSRAFPAIRPSLRITESEGLIRALREGEIDLALVEEDLSLGRIYGWEKVPLIDDELVLIAAIDHPWASRSVITMEELASQAFIMRQPESSARQLIEDRLAEAGFDPQRLTIRFELGHTEGIKRSVMAGLGLGFVSRYAIADELRGGTLAEVPIQDFGIGRTLWLVRPAEKKLPVHLQRFVEVLLSADWLPPPLRELR
jgi:DNA-binding transcriptional LysR family regulator